MNDKEITTQKNSNPIVKVEITQKSKSEILSEKIVIITGGSSGIGFCMAKRLIDEGAIVVITGRNEEKLEKACKELGKNSIYFCWDISDIKMGEKIINKVYEKYGKIDAIVNNAGINHHERNILNVTEDDFDEQFSINLKGSYFFSQAYIKKLKENNLSGNIIFISSQRGSQCDDLPYGLTKIAINSLTEALAKRFYKDGIRVNAIAPGITVSNMTGINKDDNLYYNNIAGRFFIPEEMSEVLLFLISDYSKCISGEIIHCDAGQHLNTCF